MLYKLLLDQPDFYKAAIYGGWTHPVVDDLSIDSGNALFADLAGGYRLRFTPEASGGQAVTMTWTEEPTDPVFGSPITAFRFSESALELDLGHHQTRVVTTDVNGDPVSVNWQVEEEVDGFWLACQPRTKGQQYVLEAVQTFY